MFAQLHACFNSSTSKWVFQLPLRSSDKRKMVVQRYRDRCKMTINQRPEWDTTIVKTKRMFPRFSCWFSCDRGSLTSWALVALTMQKSSVNLRCLKRKACSHSSPAYHRVRVLCIGKTGTLISNCVGSPFHLPLPAFS